MIGLVLAPLAGCEDAARLQENSEKAEETKRMMTVIDGAIEMYRMQHKNVPKTIAKAFPGRPEPKDGWGNKFVLERPGPGHKKWEVISLGADGEPDGSGMDRDIKLSEL